ncbi:hypothetical protein LCI18_006453 [Fusarium solani-melongenae]|uniref:Uncharacterized protein n=1 Tax=Fusarium solani subsp. cucurbitae TaxID=2747967 RepID=A0ACD3Z381_FUSSC|nr:hypothetical protein LCI18_006453 [Fusarium solani-melongenae]
MLGVTGTWTNTAYAWLNPSCGLTDTEGDDEGGVVDPKRPVMPEEGEQDPDENDWKSITCTRSSVEDHTKNVAERWRDIDADGAWISVIEGWQKNLTLGRPMEDFSNNVSNFFHGPQDMYCETFAEEGNRCNAAMGNNDIGGIATDFGKIPVKSNGLATSIIIDIALIGWGLVMGPTWNKVIGPKFQKGQNVATLKDETNDLVKNSLMLTKGILNSRTALDIQNGLRAQMQALADAWKESVLQFNSWIFGGSDEGNLNLGNVISHSSMMGEHWLIDRATYEKDVQRAINAFLIPLAWSLSPDGIHPFIATADVGCDEDPGWNKGDFNTQFTNPVQESALEEGKLCLDGKPYWLFGGRDVGKQCDSQQGDSWCGKFDVLPGIQELKDRKYSGISFQNLIAGSINSEKANGGRNAGPRPNGENPSRETLQSFLDNGLEAPGIWNIPICPMEEALENYYLLYGNSLDDMSNFPCNA